MKGSEIDTNIKKTSSIKDQQMKEDKNETGQCNSADVQMLDEEEPSLKQQSPPQKDSKS